MTTLTLEVPPDLYERMRQEAAQAGRPIEILVEEWLVGRFPPPTAADERARAREVLRAAGLLTEPGPELQRLASEATMTLEEINAAFARAGGKPLSEVVIEQRGPKE
jgi:hypothetical protein